MLTLAARRVARIGGAVRAPAATALSRAGFADDAAAADAAAFNPASGLVMPRKVAVIGAPVASGQGLDGVDDGPQILREQDIRGKVTDLGWRFEDLGDIEPVRPSATDPADTPPGHKARHAFAVGRSCERIAKAVKAAADDGSFVLTLGGDHSIAAGSLAGVLASRPEAGVVWVDAHADINTPESSPSGNVDVGERTLLRKLGIKAYDMHAVDKLGIARVMEEALDHLAGKAGARPLHLSFDIDACDPSIAASTGTTVKGGLNYRESHFICEELARSSLLSSMDLVEVNPRLGAAKEDGGKTAAMGVELVSSALGLSVL
ncbi:hypothetical protein FNF29_05615 [Cafeteria roenbergensis]|uniref:Arginase n=1 Tax=Cafeteria roenbergensis TaxID=33653 RepID=A0A5A8CAP9_CAFRO|nr:hypothetical protein FNF29_05615 [Cafeteria roenbergensis]|eukprot:KAA0149995.1 hypothetical protein FNF29_05615 [Cafeteria roenbergensis]